MNTTLLLTAMFLQTADSQAISDLFGVLDKDGNGLISASEISDAQRPYFKRALRVSDFNEDGQLSQSELARAISDPKPVEMNPTSRFGAAVQANFDPSVFYRNKDGYLTKDEIPEPLQVRFKQALDRGQGRVSLEVLKAYRGSDKPATSNAASDSMKKDDSKSAMPQIRPRTGTTPSAKSTPAGNKSTGARAAAAASPASFFDRLDANKDGKLTETEIPQRMRQSVRRFDRDNDKAINKAEFAEVMSAMGSRDKK